MKKLLTVSTISVIILLSSGLVLSADQSRDQVQTRDQVQIYGSELMTPQERAAHRAKMQSAKTMEERNRIRMEHHNRMKIRAKEQGVTLPDVTGRNVLPPKGHRGSGQNKSR